MAIVNAKDKTISAKLVYYGPGLCGKTTNLQLVNSKLVNGQELMSLATEGDRTIFFDFMPLELGTVRGMKVKFKLYTVPGQVRYNQTRKMVLKNADGVVFVADSQKEMVDPNLESLENLYENLEELGIDRKKIPIVLQYNKQDLPNAMAPAELDEIINTEGYQTFTASAVKGEGVVETLKASCRAVVRELSEQFEQQARPKAQAKAMPQARQGVAAASGSAGATATAAAVSHGATGSAATAGSAGALRDATSTGGVGEGRASHTTMRRAKQRSNGESRRQPVVPAQTDDELIKFLTNRFEDLENTIKTHGPSKTFGSKLDELGESVRTLLEKAQVAAPPDVDALRRAVEDLGKRLEAAPTKADLEELRKTVDILPTKPELRILAEEALDSGLSGLHAAVEKLPDEAALRKAVEGAAPGEAGSDLGAKIDALQQQLAKATANAGGDLGPKIDALQEQLAKATANAGGGDLGPKLDALQEQLATKKDLGKAIKKLAEAPSAQAPVDEAGLARALEKMLDDKLEGLRGQLVTQADVDQAARAHAERIAAEAADAVQRTTEQLVTRVDRELAAMREAMQRALAAVEAGAGAPAQPAGAAPATETATATEAETAEPTAAGAGSARETEAAAEAAQGHADEAEAEAKPDEPEAAEAEAKPDDEAEAEATPDGGPEAADAEATPDGGPEAADAEATPDGEPEAADAEATPDGEPEAADVEAKPDDEPEAAEAEAKPDDEPEAEAEAKPDDEAEAEAEAKPDDEPEAGDGEAKPEGTSDGSDDAALDERPEHKNAARVARVMVADLYLYHRDEVEEGLREGDFFERNKEALADMRATYESRVPQEVRAEKDHLEVAIDRFMAKKRSQLGLE